ncbi:MAG: SpoIIE family protein phosphatase [Leptospiraceae bacterium]|nr:SpoIIE family protein phosphatase [Leptospiraceae bacterium]
MEPKYLMNYYSLATALSSLLWGIVAFFLYKVPEKSEAAKKLVLMAFFSCMVCIGYALSQLSIVESTIPRMILIIFIPISHIMGAQFIFYFPTLRKPKTAKFFFWFQIILTYSSVIFIIIQTISNPLHYDFSGHYYEFGAEKALKIYGLISLFNALFSVVVAAVRLFQGSKENRFLYILLVIGFFISFFIPGIVNAANKLGKVDRESYIIVLCLGTVTGFFIVFVTFLNKTKDKTTFLFKVVGISFVGFMSIFNLISFFVIKEAEKTYDELKLSEIKYTAKGLEKSSNLLYILSEDKEANLTNLEFVKENFDQLKQYKESNLKLLPNPENKKRLFDISPSDKQKLIIYQWEDIALGKRYEFGFKYIDYRMYIHAISMKLFYLGLFAIGFFIIGTPIFLSGALLKPLEELLTGVKKVVQGDLTVTVPVQVHDEIGFLADSFNGMVESIRDSKRKLQDYAENLEEKVEARTKELAASLKQVEVLKEQQDGDYFLTTLLLKPLGVINKNEDSQLKIDFYVKQKKEFQFKNQDHQIGGDICISQRLILRGRKYNAFLNADAMGKSMQGAGGILVLGAVFQSIIQRTETYKGHSEVAPEKWIKMAFKELHKIFESFDGSMLISLIFGLVEEKTGLVYYINAEHPWLILFRDGKASFIEDDLTFRKLGHSGLTNDIYVTTYQLYPGDTLIMGSDGKDDLVLAKNEKERIINEDEELFLKRVEECNGNLEMIFNTIKQRYELIDDFSLMSIKFLEEEILDIETEELVTRAIEEAKSYTFNNKNYKAAIPILEKAYNESNKHKDIAELLVRIYSRLNDYASASRVCKEYIKLYETSTQMLFKASYCLKMNHEFEEAIDIAERVKLREPKNLRNLIHLADMYAYTKNYHRAEKILKKILILDPENKSAEKIANKLVQYE